MKVDYINENNNGKTVKRGYKFVIENKKYYPDNMFKGDFEVTISKEEIEFTKKYFGNNINFVQTFVGKNGCGKSTILSTMYRENFIDEMNVFINEDIAKIKFEEEEIVINKEHSFSEFRNFFEESESILKDFLLEDYEKIKDSFGVKMNFNDAIAKENFIGNAENKGLLYDFLMISSNEKYSFENVNKLENKIEGMNFKEFGPKNKKFNFYDERVIEEKEKFINNFSEENIIQGRNNEFSTILKNIEGVKLQLGNLSKGEEGILDLLITIKECFKIALKESGLKKINLYLDEPDMNLHPEWCRVFIKQLFTAIDLWTHKKEICLNVFISTHSPFIMADMPRFCVSKLSKEKGIINFERPHKSLGLEIPYLLKDEFFLKKEFGEQLIFKMNEVLEIINDSTTEKKEYVDSMKSYTDNLILKNTLVGHERMKATLDKND